MRKVHREALEAVRPVHDMGGWTVTEATYGAAPKKKVKSKMAKKPYKPWNERSKWSQTSYKVRKSAQKTSSGIGYLAVAAVGYLIYRDYKSKTGGGVGGGGINIVMPGDKSIGDVLADLLPGGGDKPFRGVGTTDIVKAAYNDPGGLFGAASSVYGALPRNVKTVATKSAIDFQFPWYKPDIGVKRIYGLQSIVKRTVTGRNLGFTVGNVIGEFLWNKASNTFSHGSILTSRSSVASSASVASSVSNIVTRKSGSGGRSGVISAHGLSGSFMKGLGKSDGSKGVAATIKLRNV